MKKSTGKKLLIALLAIVLMAALAVFASAEGEPTIIDSGYCGGEGDGTNLTWTLDSEGTLTVSGTGKWHKNYDVNPLWSDIRKVIIKEGVTSIGYKAFMSCEKLESIYISKTVEMIQYLDYAMLVGYGTTLKGDGALRTIIVDEDNPSFSSDGHSLFDKDKSILYLYVNNGEEEYTVPDSVQTIWESATVASKGNLKRLTIPESVNQIRQNIYTGYLAEEITILNPNCQIDEGFWCCGECILHGYKGSTTETYAKNHSLHGFSFLPLCPANYHYGPTSYYPVISATCVSIGYESGTYCKNCNQWLYGHEEIPIDSTNHINPAAPVQEHLIPSTCKTPGSYDEVVYCTDCGEEISRTKKMLPLLEHTPGRVAIVNIIITDCEIGGSAEGVTYCDVCGEEISRQTVSIPAMQHVVETWTNHDIHADTAYREGVCEICGKTVREPIDPQPEEPSSQPAQDEPPQNLNFFQRVSAFFANFFESIRNFFARLFGR